MTVGVMGSFFFKGGFESRSELPASSDLFGRQHVGQAYQGACVRESRVLGNASKGTYISACMHTYTGWIVTFLVSVFVVIIRWK